MDDLKTSQLELWIQEMQLCIKNIEKKTNYVVAMYENRIFNIQLQLIKLSAICICIARISANRKLGRQLVTILYSCCLIFFFKLPSPLDLDSLQFHVIALLIIIHFNVILIIVVADLAFVSQ